MRIFALQPSENGLETRITRSLKPHTTPVVSIAIASTGSLLATGGANGEVKVWDLRGGYTTHTFHGHSGVVSALCFFEVPVHLDQTPKTSRKRKSGDRNTIEKPQQESATLGYRLASGGEDGRVRIWDLHARKGVATLEAHVSVVRSLSYSPEKNILLTASRDKTISIWDAATWAQRSTVAILEVIEKAGFLSSGTVFFTGGENARLRLWNTDTGQEMTEEQESGTDLEAILDILHYPELPFLVSIRADQTLLLHSLEPLSGIIPDHLIAPLPVIQRISGTHDEVIDLAYIGTSRDKLALATNLEEIRIISLDTASAATSSYFGADIALLQGHDDIIVTLAVDWSGHWLATGAKDNTAKLWRLDTVNDEYDCFATFTGHAESIGAVSLPSATPAQDSKEYKDPLNHPPKFLISGSQDKTVKRWNISSGSSPKTAYTRKAHDKDINAIATSYSTTSPMFASASQDRTVKIWDVETGEAIGVLRGHKRGVWSVAFAPPSIPALLQGDGGAASTSKGMVVTGSGDKTVRIWSLADYTCLRTFEGHANSILKVVWLPSPQGRGRPLIRVASAAGDGLVKVWDAQDGECVSTLDNHIDRVWALAVKPTTTSRDAEVDVSMDEVDEGTDLPKSQLELVSGSADSTLTFWVDTSESTAKAATAQATQRVEQDQELQNHIRAQNYREAIVLALQLNHPKRLLDLFATVTQGIQQPGSFTGNPDVDQAIQNLSDGQLWNLLRRIRDWNTNGRTHYTAQHILYAVLRLIPKERLLSLRRRKKGVEVDSQDEELAAAMTELSTQEKNRESVKDVLDGLKAYTERHYQRIEKNGEERFVLLWALQQMDEVGGDVLMANGHT